jgi:uncharacterized protein
MSAFDDEFGLFGDEDGEDEERRSTLGARRIAGGETIIDDIEPEDEGTPRRRRGRPAVSEKSTPPAEAAAGRRVHRRAAVKREPLSDEVAHARAVELLTFLAKKLVGKPDEVEVVLHPDPKGALLELEVDPEDLGKVIGRGGRVAQALRTLVRACAEGRVVVDILDAEAEEEDAEEEGSPEPPEVDSDLEEE